MTKFFKKYFFDPTGRIDRVYVVYLFWCLFVLVTTSLVFKLFGNVAIVYSNKLQVALFTGFLTLGSFLLTLKTFVLVQFKQQLFGRSVYKSVFKSAFKRADYRQGDYYHPLNYMAQLLLLAVITALGTSFFQITFGFIVHPLISSACIGLAVATLLIVFYCWWIVRENTIRMIKYWETEAIKDMSKKKTQG